EIQSDLQQTKASQRLIQGDVGSGKTLLGFLAVAAAVDSGLQGVFMAPTELLAAQHFKNITTLLGDRVSIVLLTGSLSASRKKAIYEQIQTGAAQIIIGTQAVFQEKVVFAKLGVAIIDEQQRFGVAQRTYLLQKGVTDAVHCFTLTATPIPRTLSMALFGTIQLSILKEKPQGRAPITTYLTPAQKEHLVLKSIKNCVARGQSVYWICPLISESEVINASAAQQRFSILKEHPDLSDIKVGLLHGRMNASDRHDVLQAFYNGDYHVLVSTLVIEVGIDHPLATLIIIESPDRLGLSQLHQLRGRVGRSNLASYCLLLYDQNISEKGMERLTALCETDDGFKLAEMDLAIRGPGEFLGARQSGFQSLKFFSFDNNMDMIEDVLIKIKSLDQEQHRWISEFFQHNVNSDYWEHSVTQ
ncbi:MAG: DEAD/DEAH box helicase, partial [Gammaproteobacteria bacterium]|nr:DEAD/DEAH box helicase [Gammaproteobacteria bacterium]